MYQPDHFRAHDLPQMRALMRAKPFATLISAGPAGLQATHLPTVLRDDEPDGVIECHLARANPHWKDLAEGNEALLIFHGPEISPSPATISSASRNGARTMKARTTSLSTRSPSPFCAREIERPISGPRGTPSTQAISPPGPHSQRNSEGEPCGIAELPARRIDARTRRRRSIRCTTS